MRLVRHSLLTAVALVVGAVAVLGGCGSTSPTTTFTDDGDRVTVDWADYPGHARIVAEEALAAHRRRSRPSGTAPTCSPTSRRP